MSAPAPNASAATEDFEFAALNEARNLAIIRTADVLVAVGGSYGTLSEIGFALKAGKKVIGLETWDIRGMVPVATAEEAVRLATE